MTELFITMDLTTAWIILAIFSLIVGSFLNVVIYRLPIIVHYQCSPKSEHEKPYLSLLLPNSYCPLCKHSLKIMHNIPIFSYIFLRGRCNFCNAKISTRYPIVESITLVTAITVAFMLDTPLEIIAGLLFSWFLIVLAFIDIDTQLLLDELTITLLWIGLLLSIGNVFVTPESAIIGAIVAYVFFWTLNQLFSVLANKQGLGYGDMKLLAAFGAWFGWESLHIIILLASSLGLSITLLLIALKKIKRDERIAFGPYLCCAAWIYLIFTFDLHNILPSVRIAN